MKKLFLKTAKVFAHLLITIGLLLTIFFIYSIIWENEISEVNYYMKFIFTGLFTASLGALISIFIHINYNENQCF